MLVPSQQSKDGEYQWVEDLLTDTAKMAWTFRVELTLLAVPVVLWFGLSSSAGRAVASLGSVAVITAAVAVPQARQWILDLLYKARLRRAWASACEDVELKARNGAVPVVCKAERIPAGDQLLVRVPRGSSVAEIESRAERIAATLGAREIRVTRSERNAAFATVVIVRRDSLETPAPLRWPRVSAPQLSLWKPIPVGIDENGKAVGLRLPERNVLIGGEPGAGKSAALSMLVATAALDPNAKLWLLDGKQVELAAWSPIAEQTVGPSTEEAIELLGSLRQEMDDRYRHLLDCGLRKVTAQEGLPLHVVVCDELAYYLTGSDRKQRNEFGDLMRDLVSRGRAAGIIVIAATQKPSGDIIPTSLRDLFGFRWAMRCNTPQASDTILGTGWATQGYDASTIPGAQRGVGYLHTEGAKPVRIKSCYLTDEQITEIAVRAAGLRELNGHATHSGQELAA